MRINFDAPRSLGVPGSGDKILEGHNRGKSITVIYKDGLPFNFGLRSALI